MSGVSELQNCLAFVEKILPGIEGVLISAESIIKSIPFPSRNKKKKKACLSFLRNDLTERNNMEDANKRDRGRYFRLRPGFV